MADILDMLKQAAEQIGLSKDQINTLGESFSNLTDKIGVTVNATSILNNAFEELADSSIINNISNMGKALQDTSLLTEKQTNTLMNLNSIIGVTSKSFTGLGAENLNTFKRQLDDVLNGIQAGAEPLKDLRNLASALKIPTAGLDSFDKLRGAIVKYAGNMAENADEALRFQNSILKTAAAAGSLDQIVTQAGGDLKNLNNVLVAQRQYLNEVGKATQQPIDTINEYYTSLARIPGALQSTVKGASESQANINMLTAAMQYSSGSGREFKEIVEDLNTAFVDYNLVGEDALKFTSRIGQLANNFNIQLDKVRGAVISTSSALKMFGHDGQSASGMMEGAARIMNNYIQALKDTGISGSSAIDVISNMTKQVGELNVAQRSFVSSQTGGAGGLRGAFQIEKLIREDKIDEVMEKVRKTMTQQFGRIVSVEEAAQSESAASMLVKQREMLKSGPLGGLARNEQEAGRLVEAFAAMGKGGGTKELSDILQTTMSRGEELQKQTATPMSMMRADTNAIRNILQVGGLANFQQLMAASVGKRVELTDTQRQRMASITGSMSRGVARGGQMAELIGGSEDRLNNTLSTTYTAQNIDDFKSTLTDVLPKTLKGFIESLGIGDIADKLSEKLFDSRKETDIMIKKSEGMSGSEREKMEKEIAKRRAEEASMEQGLNLTREFNENARKKADADAYRKATSNEAMEAVARSRYDSGEQNTPGMVAEAISETAPAMAATGGALGRRGEGAEKETKEVKVSPEEIVIVIKNEKDEELDRRVLSVSSAAQK